MLPWYLGYTSFTPAEQALSDAVAKAWAALAATGDPNSDLPLLPRWPRYGAGGTGNATMVLDVEPSVSTAWAADLKQYCAFWSYKFIGPFPKPNMSSRTFS